MSIQADAQVGHIYNECHHDDCPESVQVDPIYHSDKHEIINSLYLEPHYSLVVIAHLRSHFHDLDDLLLT